MRTVFADFEMAAVDQPLLRRRQWGSIHYFSFRRLALYAQDIMECTPEEEDDVDSLYKSLLALCNPQTCLKLRSCSIGDDRDSIIKTIQNWKEILDGLKETKDEMVSSLCTQLEEPYKEHIREIENMVSSLQLNKRRENSSTKLNHDLPSWLPPPIHYDHWHPIQ